NRSTPQQTPYIPTPRSTTDPFRTANESAFSDSLAATYPPSPPDSSTPPDTEPRRRSPAPSADKNRKTPGPMAEPQSAPAPPVSIRDRKTSPADSSAPDADPHFRARRIGTTPKSQTQL